MKPILFNTEMVNATQGGRKIVTRRVVRPQPPSNAQLIMGICSHGDYAFDESIGSPGPDDRRVYMAPYRHGDTLEVREKWRVSHWRGPGFPLLWFEFADGTRGESVEIKNRDMFERLVTQSREDARKANCAFDGVDYVWAEGEAPTRWRPSIHMPKEAARIFLRVTAVRVEKLQKSFFRHGDAVRSIAAEGIDIGDQCRECIEAYGCPCCIDDESECGILDDVRDDFARLWDSTIPKHPNKFKRYPLFWKDNPWVWVVEFERCERPTEGGDAHV